MTLADGKSVRFGADKESSGDPHWSPDGQWIAYRGRVGEKSGLVIAQTGRQPVRRCSRKWPARTRRCPGSSTSRDMVARRQANRVRLGHARP